MEIGKKASEDFYKETGKRPLMHPFHFGTFFEVFSCCKLKKRLTDSIDFYSKNVEKLEAKMSDLRESTKKLSTNWFLIINLEFLVFYLKKLNVSKTVTISI